MAGRTVSFNTWLQDHLTPNDGNYRHRRLDERRELRSLILPRLKQIVYEAHDDARRHLRRIDGVSLDPLEIPVDRDPAEGYPEWLPLSTLMGYFGEIFSGLFCENFAPLGEQGWEVPAYLFRTHLHAFRYLERMRQESDFADRQIFGREGDDCLAFILDDNGDVQRAMFCEAKCQKEGDKREIESAHRKVSDVVDIPLDRQQLIQVLQDSDDPEASRWIEALRRLRFRGDDPGYERCDLVCYICGQVPRDASRMPMHQPHPSYTGGRRLEAVEIYIDRIRQLVRETYGRDQAAEE